MSYNENDFYAYIALQSESCGHDEALFSCYHCRFRLEYDIYKGRKDDICKKYNMVIPYKSARSLKFPDSYSSVCPIENIVKHVANYSH
jgi:hypothetical protein